MAHLAAAATQGAASYVDPNPKNHTARQLVAKSSPQAEPDTIHYMQHESPAAAAAVTGSLGYTTTSSQQSKSNASG